MCAHMRNLLELNKRTLKKDPVSTTGPSAFKSRCAFQMKTPAVCLELTKRLQPYFLQVPPCLCFLADSPLWGVKFVRGLCLCVNITTTKSGNKMRLHSFTYMKKKNVRVSLDINISLDKVSFPLIDSEYLDITY